MGRVSYYDEIELEDMSYDEDKDLFHYPCPCGDRFEITRVQLKEAEDVARCPSCSLIIRVVFDPVSRRVTLTKFELYLALLRRSSWEIEEVLRKRDDAEPQRPSLLLQST